jgi:hypothetical protein
MTHDVEQPVTPRRPIASYGSLSPVCDKRLVQLVRTWRSPVIFPPYLQPPRPFMTPVSHTSYSMTQDVDQPVTPTAHLISTYSCFLQRIIEGKHKTRFWSITKNHYLRYSSKQHEVSVASTKHKHHHQPYDLVEQHATYIMVAQCGLSCLPCHYDEYVIIRRSSAASGWKHLLTTMTLR